MDEGSRDCGGFVCERDGDGRGAADPEGTEQGGMINGWCWNEQVWMLSNGRLSERAAFVVWTLYEPFVFSVQLYLFLWFLFSPAIFPIAIKYGAPVFIPRGRQIKTYTPTGLNGATFQTKYGVAGLTRPSYKKGFIAEGLNEAGLSAGLFYFPRNGTYSAYDLTENNRTVNNLQLVSCACTIFFCRRS